jgi:hypothetical protein
MSDRPISELTVDQLVSIIRKTVHEAVLEVLIEFSVAADQDADVTYRAEMTEIIRDFLHQGLEGALPDPDEPGISDD